MLEFFAQKWQSLVFRLLFYFLLSILALVVVFSISFAQRIKPHVQQQVLPNIVQYLHYLIDDIGHPPDLGVAQRLADELPFEIRIEGDGFDWSSQPGIAPLSSFQFRPAPPPYENISFSHSRRKELVLIREHGLNYLFIVEDSFRRGAERRHWLLFASLGTILLLLYFAIRRLLRPIGVISGQVRKIGEGDLQQKVPVSGRGELGMLAAGINRMSQQIGSMLESKSALLLAISHELRSPLTRMRVNLELIEDSDAQRQLIEDCREMEALVAAILESEKLGSGHAPLSLGSCRIDELVRDVVSAHPERERIHCSLARLELEIDALRFRLLLKNLVDNACHYSAEGGEEVEIRLRADNDDAILEISDRGIGIASEDISRLTEAFYRTDDSRQRNTGGYGLGLYLCQLIVDAHGGVMTIESEPGLGTRVIVRIPLDNS